MDPTPALREPLRPWPELPDDPTGLQDYLEDLARMTNGYAVDASPEFTPAELREVASLGAGEPLEVRWELMRQRLAEDHPGVVADELRWVFNASGNVVCQLALVYASPTEYVAFFGTPVGATGFSGRYNHADVWDVMVAGEMLTHEPGQFEPTRFAPGQTAFLQSGTGKVFRYMEDTWMIDYARGNILTMFPYGVIAPAMFNTLDYESAWDQVEIYARLVLKSLFRAR